MDFVSSLAAFFHLCFIFDLKYIQVCLYIIGWLNYQNIFIGGPDCGGSHSEDGLQIRRQIRLDLYIGDNINELSHFRYQDMEEKGHG